MKFVTGTLALALLFSINAIGGENKEALENDAFEAKVKIAEDTIKETGVGSAEVITTKWFHINAKDNSRKVLAQLPSERPLVDPRINLELKQEAFPFYVQDTQEARARLLDAEKRRTKVPREIIKRDVARYKAAIEAEEKAKAAIDEAEAELAKLEAIAANERSANPKYRIAKINEAAHKYLVRIAGLDAVARIAFAMSGKSAEQIGAFAIDDLLALANEKINDLKAIKPVSTSSTTENLAADSNTQNSDAPVAK